MHGKVGHNVRDPVLRNMQCTVHSEAGCALFGGLDIAPLCERVRTFQFKRSPHVADSPCLYLVDAKKQKVLDTERDQIAAFFFY